VFHWQDQLVFLNNFQGLFTPFGCLSIAPFTLQERMGGIPFGKNLFEA